MTQRQFANKLGVPLTSYTNWVLGLRTPNMEVIQKICSRLSVSADWLLGLSTAPPPIEKRVTMGEESGAYRAVCHECEKKDHELAKKQEHVERLERIIDKLTK